MPLEDLQHPGMSNTAGETSTQGESDSRLSV
jgi:hypothetical protein